MKIALRLIALAGCLVLVQCASMRETKISDGIDVSFVSNRVGELEPCGCSTNPQGGLVREFEMYRQQNIKGIRLTGGVSFIPLPETYSSKLTAHYGLKAEYMVRGLNKLNTAALFPSAADTLIGLKRLKQVEKLANFPFVSANLVDRKTGKALFRPYIEKEVNGHLLTFIGITASVYPGYPKPREVRVLSPEKALEKVLNKLSNRSRRVLFVVSDLYPGAREKLLDYGAHFFLGGDLERPENAFLQDRPKTVWTNPRNRGQTVAVIRFKPVIPVTHLWSENAVETFRSFSAEKTLEIHRLEKQLEDKKLKKRQVAKIKSRIVKLEKLINRNQRLTQPLASHFTQYEGTLINLDKKYEPKGDSPLKKLMADYQAALKKRALSKPKANKSSARRSGK